MSAGRDLFMRHLDPDPVRAEAEYQELREKLAFFFARKSCGDPYQLADEVVRIVILKLDGPFELTTRMSGYCYGVAKKLAKNYIKRKGNPGEPFDERIHTPESLAPSMEEVLTARQLMGRLKFRDRKLMEDFLNEGTKAAAAGQGISVNAAGLRVHRIIKSMRAFAKGKK